MSEPVIPNAELPGNPPPSPAVVAKRQRVAWAHRAVEAVGALTIRAVEAEKAAELMRYLDDRYAEECRELDSLIASEMLGAPVKVDGSFISKAYKPVEDVSELD